LWASPPPSTPARISSPATGFDLKARRDAWDTIDGLRRLAATIVLTAHAMDEAERLTDRIAVIVAAAWSRKGRPERSAAVMLPPYLASGIFIPNASLPSWLRQLASVFPVERLSDALHRPFAPGAHGLAIAWADLGVMALWGAGRPGRRDAAVQLASWSESNSVSSGTASAASWS
jgi:hypothetical protein